MAKILGIDLGATNSCMAIMDSREPRVVESTEGTRTTPSVVAFTKSGECLVGGAAKRQAVMNPENTIFSIKRLMGCQYDEVQGQLPHTPYTILRAANGGAHVQVQAGGATRTLSPPEISAMILAKLKADAEAKLGGPITHAVVTVPAYFNQLQRDATRAAGTIAGFEATRIITESTAASLAYGFQVKEERNIAVVDLGGGSLSISVLDIGDGVFAVKATSGDMRLGGNDWGQAVTEWLLAEFHKEHGIDLRREFVAMQRIREEVEKARIELSFSREFGLNLPFITAGKAGPIHIAQTLTREKLEDLTGSLAERMVKPFRDCVKDAGLSEEEIDELVLVGGMTRMPQVVEIARRLLSREPHKGVNPDEAVALGAAVVGGVMNGDLKDVLWLDTTPFTLALETVGGVATPMIPRNTTIPTRKSQIFQPGPDRHTSIEFTIVEGERPLSSDNQTLGTLRLDGILPDVSAQIEVTFDIDGYGILRVCAKDISTGKEQKMQINGRPGWTK